MLCESVKMYFWIFVVDSTPVLVLDNGSGFLKAGYSNEAVPSQIVSSVVGTPLRYSQDISGIEYSAKPGSVFGDQATGKAGVLRIGMGFFIV